MKPSVRPRTYRSYGQIVGLHPKPALGRHHLAKLAPEHVQRMMNDKLADGLSPRTVQHLRAVLKQALGQALKWGPIGRNVATLVDPPRSFRHEIAFLAPAQARPLLHAAVLNVTETAGVVLPEEAEARVAAISAATAGHAAMLPQPGWSSGSMPPCFPTTP